MDKLLFKRILVAALTILAVVYVTYLLISANFDMYPTENAIKTTVTRTISADGFIIREETVIKNDSQGVLSYNIDNGAAVEANSAIARVYSNEADAVSNSRADELEAKVRLLQESQNSSLTGAVSVDVINNSIKSNLINYLYDANKLDLSSVKNDADRLLTYINQRQLLTGKITNFNEQISALNAQISQLRSSAGSSTGSVVTPVAGYFSEFCDGYEDSFPFSRVKDMTLSDLKSIKRGSVPSNSAGKVVSNVNWYVCCEISDDDAAMLSIYDGEVTVLISAASTEPIPAILRRVQRNKGGNALAVLECDYMDSRFLAARYEPVEIGMGTFTGLRVSKRAIHDDYVTKTTYDENDKPHKEKKKVQGVYVLYGSEVQFKQISILYASKDYVICDPDPPENVLFNGDTISLYDKVIVKGDDLYDGKVIS